MSLSPQNSQTQPTPQCWTSSLPNSETTRLLFKPSRLWYLDATTSANDYRKLFPTRLHGVNDFSINGTLSTFRRVCPSSSVLVFTACMVSHCQSSQNLPTPLLIKSHRLLCTFCHYKRHHQKHLLTKGMFRSPGSHTCTSAMLILANKWPFIGHPRCSMNSRPGCHFLTCLLAWSIITVLNLAHLMGDKESPTSLGFDYL